MTTHTGVADRVVAYVTAHPGCLRSKLLAALGLGSRDAMPTYCTKTSRIYLAGSRGTQRYYPTLAEAFAADAGLRAEAEQRRRQKREDAHRRQNLRRRAGRAAAGSRLVTTRPGQCLGLAPGVTLSLSARIQIEHAPAGRFDCLGRPPAVVDASQARPWAQACAAHIEARA